MKRKRRGEMKNGREGEGGEEGKEGRKGKEIKRGVRERDKAFSQVIYFLSIALQDDEREGGGERKEERREERGREGREGRRGGKRREKGRWVVTRRKLIERKKEREREREYKRKCDKSTIKREKNKVNYNNI